MLWESEEIGRVLGSQIYIYNSPEEIPADPPRGVNDVFIDINLGKVYQWDGTEWKYKFPIPNDSRIVDIVDELTALGASLADAESARVVAENARVGAEQSRVAAETAREAAEATRQSNETARQGAESARASAETSRANAESLREEAEGARQTAEGARATAEGAREEAEANRASAESARATAESGRASAEQARVSAESARATAEGQRNTAETARANAESARASAETARQANESTRQSQEQTRQGQESARQTAEGARAGAEQTRAQNEVARQVAESNREDAEGLRVQAENTRATNDATWNEHEQTRQANEAQRVLAEQARVNAEAGRQAELDSKITYGSDWFDGSGGTAYADLADNLKTNKGVHVIDEVAQYGPISQAVEDGSYAKMDDMKGRSFAYNQLLNVPDDNFTDNGVNVVSSSSSMSFTFNGAQAVSNVWFLNNRSDYVPLVEGHRILAVVDKDIPTNLYLWIQYQGSSYNSVTMVSSGKVGLFTAPITGVYDFAFRQTDSSKYHTFNNETYIIQLFDLTAMGINTDDVDEAIAALRSYGIEPTVYNEHSAGNIIDSQPNKIISRGINQWNEEWEVGALNSDGTLDTNSGRRTTSFIRIGSNMTVYQHSPGSAYGGRIAFFDANKNVVLYDGDGITSVNKTYQAPQDAYFVRITFGATYGITYNHDITIAFGTTDPGYHAYVEDPHDLVLPVMRSAKGVADDKEFVRVGTYTFTGNEVWVFNEQYQMWAFSGCTDGKNGTNTICSNGVHVHKWNVNNMYVYLSYNPQITSSTNMNELFPSGTKLNYELAAPVAQDPAISLPQNIKVWNGGSLETQYEAPNTTPGLISLTYQANVKAMVEGVSEREDINWNPENVVSHGQLQEGLAPKADTEDLRNGEIVPALSDNLVATKGVTVNDDPMSFGMVGGAQKSAVGDGNASLNKLVCVDVVKNQLVTTFIPNIAGVSVTHIGSKYTITGTSTETGTKYWGFTLNTNKMVSGHIYYAKDFKIFSGDTRIQLNGSPWTGLANISSTNFIFTSPAGGEAICYCNVTEGDVFDFTGEPTLIDLTQRYGNNEVVNAIIGTGTDAEKVARLLAFDPKILNDTDYDAGTLVSSKTAKLLSVGVNQWNEEWEVGGYYTSTGTKNDTVTNTIRNKNPIRVNAAYPLFAGVNVAWVLCYGKDGQYIGQAEWLQITGGYIWTLKPGTEYVNFFASYGYGSTYNHDICINVSDPNINGKYYPPKRTPVPLPNYEGHGILKVVDGKVVADGTELYPDGNSKKRYVTYTFTGNEQWNYYTNGTRWACAISSEGLRASSNTNNAIISKNLGVSQTDNTFNRDGWRMSTTSISFRDSTNFPEGVSPATLFTAGTVIGYELETEQDVTTPVFQSTFPVEQGGTLQFLDEDDNPIAGLQGSEIFYQKNIKAFVEALGEATDWDPERIKRLGDLSFTPEYVDITLNPSPTGAYARAQVYNASFTIVISAALAGTPNGSITFQDSEIDLSNFQTKPADYLYDMDGKKVSEAPVTANCNIASFVGRSKSGTVLWSLLHSGVNKVKIHIEEAVPLDSDGNGKIDCRTNMIL